MPLDLCHLFDRNNFAGEDSAPRKRRYGHRGARTRKPTRHLIGVDGRKMGKGEDVPQLHRLAQILELPDGWRLEPPV